MTIVTLGRYWIWQGSLILFPEIKPAFNLHKLTADSSFVFSNTLGNKLQTNSNKFGLQRPVFAIHSDSRGSPSIASCLVLSCKLVGLKFSLYLHWICNSMPNCHSALPPPCLRASLNLNFFLLSEKYCPFNKRLGTINFLELTLEKMVCFSWNASLTFRRWALSG